uniref:Diterpene synthase TPS2 n=1 Tax=Plectranthus barbatus TaxID=41228 RepID=X4ZWN5_9LAMI|nr:diterpene synthase TPS2 [Plectranthus barbatus]
MKMLMIKSQFRVHSIVSAWANNSNKRQSLGHQIRRKQRSQVTECRVASLDALNGIQKVGPATIGTPEEENKKIEDSIEYVKELLKTMGDGRISVSPYDTAIVALIKDLEGGDGPEFPSCLEWIAQNQLADGSWGDHFFCIYDRVVNTAACVVALKSWNVHADKIEKGAVYLKENVHKLKDGKIEHMPAGFEFVVPATLERAKALGIKGLPYDDPFIREIYSAKQTRLTKIPKGMIYESPTSLLYSLDGLEGLEWDKILKLQSADGSFITSVSSTAFVFMHTNDLKCHAFIKNALTNCNGGVPHTYPVDIFARLWAVDRLQRLGISRFFEPEIKYLMDHINNVWREKGVFSSRHSQFADIDDTSMGIRLLKMHGYNVNPNALEHFKQKDGKFTCYADQHIESPSPMYNLYRAAQLRFPGEEILQQALQFAYNFLHENLASNHFQEKWVISDHLIDEVRIGLKMPWYATLPRVEASYYLQHYGGSSDVWIGKTLYRMPEISNDTYKILAQLDFNKCQAQHQLEWMSMKEWYQSNNVKEFGISKKELLLAYFLAAATMFEPERTQERIMWAKTQVVSRMITSFLNKENTMSFDLKIALLTQPQHQINGSEMKNGLAQTLPAAFRQLLKEFDKYTRHQLRNTWNKWLMKLKQGDDNGGADAELLANTLNICAGHNEDILSHYEYTALSSLTNKICQRLSQIQDKKMLEIEEGSIKDKEMELEIQTLVKLVLQETSGGIDRNIKQTFLSVFKTFYYRAYHDAKTIDAHIFQVLFEPVV